MARSNHHVCYNCLESLTTAIKMLLAFDFPDRLGYPLIITTIIIVFPIINE